MLTDDLAGTATLTSGDIANPRRARDRRNLDLHARPTTPRRPTSTPAPTWSTPPRVVTTEVPGPTEDTPRRRSRRTPSLTVAKDVDLADDLGTGHVDLHDHGRPTPATSTSPTSCSPTTSPAPPRSTSGDTQHQRHPRDRRNLDLHAPPTTPRRPTSTPAPTWSTPPRRHHRGARPDRGRRHHHDHPDPVVDGRQGRRPRRHRRPRAR